MLGERIASKSEVIRAIASGCISCCGVSHWDRQGELQPAAAVLLCSATEHVSACSCSMDSPDSPACVAGVHAPAKPVCGRHGAGTVVL